MDAHTKCLSILLLSSFTVAISSSDRVGNENSRREAQQPALMHRLMNEDPDVQTKIMG